MCSSGGLFYYTGNSSQIINNRTVESFSGFCSNGETVDTDCTYTIGSAGLTSGTSLTTNSPITTSNTSNTSSSSSNTEIGDTWTGTNDTWNIYDVPTSQPWCGSAAAKVYTSWNDANAARRLTYGSCPNGDGFLQPWYNPVTGFPLSGTSSWNCTTWTVNPAYTAGGYYAVTANCSLGVNIEAWSAEDSKTILGYPPINPLSSTRCGDASGHPYDSWGAANAARNAKNGTCTSGGNSSTDGNLYKQAYSDVITLLPIVRVNGYQREELTWNCTGWNGAQYVVTASCSLQVSTRINTPIPIITTASTTIVTTSNTVSTGNSTTSTTQIVNPLTSGASSNTDQTYSIQWVVTGGGSGLSGITVDVMRNGNVVLGTVTNANGNYVASGLSAGWYEVRPRNNEQYIFPNTQSVTIVDANVGANFSGLKLTDLDPAVAELLRRTSTDNTTTTTTTDSGTSINDWINNIINRIGGWDGDGGTGTDDIVGGGTSLASGNSFSNIFSENSLISLLRNWYIPLANSYSPVGLSLIKKYANQNSICGDGVKEEGETCDDGINNGRGSNYCSSDCLYFGEVRFTSELASDALGNWGTIGNWRVLHTLQVAGNTVGKVFSSAFDGIDSGVSTLSGTFDSIQKRLKQKIVENTSPETRKVIKEVAKYSLAGVITLLAALAAGLHFMIYKSQWMSYTIQEWDTLDSLGSKFTMTSRAIKAKNSLLKKWGLRPGMKIKVRNRHFIEKDYLDQLKSVLKDGLDKRNHGKMASKIEKIFTKK